MSEGGFKYVEIKRTSKAQKRREAKAAKRDEQIKRIEEAEKMDEHQERRLEQESLKKLLDRCQLKIHEIDADGDCLYRAVEHQLSLAPDSDERLSFQDIRNRTSEHMLNNSADFLPFLLNDQGDLMSETDFKNYCQRIAKTKEWGGHLELTAISRFTRKPIHIYQAHNKKPIMIEPLVSTDKQPMLLSFHKHLYHLGEHYNSLVRA
jgi:OTU domain-containing protein 6